MNYRSVFFAITTVAVLCGCSAGVKADKSLESEAVTTVGELTQNNVGDKGTDTSLKSGEIPHLILESLNRTVSEKNGDSTTLYKELSYGHISLAPEERDIFPKLNEAFTALNNETDEGVDEAIARLEQFSYDAANTHEDILNEYSYISSETVDYVFRSDYKAVSLLRNNYFSLNGNKSDIHYKSFNIDTGTGNNLKLKDVVVDTDLFFESLGDVINNEYGEEYKSHLEKYKGEQEKKDFTDLAWTITQEGITVYFDPLTLGTEEEAVVSLYFDEKPELFNKDYGKTLEDYIIPVIDENVVRLDVNGDGKRDDVSVKQSDNEVSVKAGDREVKDIYSYSTQVYVVKKNGKYYLYMFTSQDNDYVVLDTIDLKTMDYNASNSQNIQPATVVNSWGDNEINYSSTTEIKFVDTNLFTGDSNLNVLSTYFGRRNYKVGNDGKPEALDKYYNVVGNQVIQANADIECEEVNIVGEDGKKATIPAGSYLMLLRTDGESLADVRVLDSSQVNMEDSGYDARISSDIINEINEDETMYRLNIDMKEWPGKINGTDVEELFTGLHFAG